MREKRLEVQGALLPLGSAGERGGGAIGERLVEGIQGSSWCHVLPCFFCFFKQGFVMVTKTYCFVIMFCGAFWCLVLFFVDGVFV